MIEAREQELVNIRDGRLKATKRTRSTTDTKHDAFNNYIKMFYDLQKITVSFVHSFCSTQSYDVEPVRKRFKMSIVMKDHLTMNWIIYLRNICMNFYVDILPEK